MGAARAMIPVPKRISYLIGADGVIVETYPKVDPGGHAEEVLADLERLGVGSNSTD